MSPSDLVLNPLPLAGRSDELARLRSLLDQTETGNASATILRGEGGVGKTRLLSALVDDAERRGWTVLHGQAFPVGSSAPYSLFADAFVPLIRGLDSATLSVLTRGGESDLSRLFPSLGHAEPVAASQGSPDELKMRLFWNFTQLLRGLSGRAPLLLVLEDLQWADEPSLELLHFVVRETKADPLLVVGSYNDRFREQNPPLMQTEQSLARMGLLDVMSLQPLGAADVLDLTCEVFGADRMLVSDFAGRLFEWTAGNPFFVQETLNGLVQSGQLRRGEGAWVGFETDRFAVPGSLREAVIGRLATLDTDAQQVANVAAVVGNRVPHAVLMAATEIPEGALLSGIDGLRARHVLRERPDGSSVAYEFIHPLVRETIYQELGHARARMLHGRAALALEGYYGAANGGLKDENAGELAYHFARSSDETVVHKEILYLARAGRAAFARHAYRPAAETLGMAVERMASLTEQERTSLLATDPDLAGELDSIKEDRAWADLAVGNVEEALEFLDLLYGQVSDPSRRIRIARRLVRAHFWNGQPAEGLRWADRALGDAGGAEPARAQLNLLRGLCLEQLGRAEEAGTSFRAVLEAGRASKSDGLQARAHQALALLSLWTGNPEGVHHHAELAYDFAQSCGAGRVEFWSLWVRATFFGLTGEVDQALNLIEQAQAVGSRLGSPHLRLWAAEILIEHSAATGDWERGLTIGEHAIELADNLGYRAVLPRLLVWTGFVHIARGDLERAQRLMDRAWEMSVEGADAEGADVHAFVPAHTGRAALLLARGEYDRALEVGARGLEAADSTGYFIWGVHRLLPTMAEAHIQRGDLEGARAIGARLRKDSERINHRLGLAWSDACDALVQWKSGDSLGAVERLGRAADALDAVPFVWDAARIRRQRAGRLAEVGDAPGAIAELKRAHEVFARVGAAYELSKTRNMFRQLGVRPPSRTPSSGAGTGSLTGREVEVARMVSERKSNKAIAKELDISARTVSTHLSNIFKKVGVSTRGELADVVRTTLLPD